MAARPDPAFLRRFQARVPRYTSYPTAPQFHGGITAGTYRDWLAGIGDGEPVSLYVHVPFCNEMCWFCACHTRIVRRYGPIGDYAALLQREISLVAEATASRPTVTHIHFGGGTPNMLSRDDFSALTATIRERFRLADNAEFAVEVDPRTLTKGKAAGLASCGVTRASLGVQDLNAPVQTAINRIQPYEMTARTAGWLRRSGIEAINIDLMYGLPHQTVEHVVRTVDLAVRLAPNRLAVFGYAHVPWMKKHQRMIDEAALPDPAERF
ncbi:MAG: radical SAM protein, partial [Alphaproteobacteria bacterium]